ncbi:MAG: radical SAM protein [Bacteroidales bacterium]|nr:radical SAM protein [Bacteroidales bacterium]
MATFLFDKIIFGPVQSRRLGASLGINLMPNDRKICTFDCIYCECGWTDQISSSSGFHDRGEVQKSLEKRLQSMKDHGEPLDAITFAGNGEPTMHPRFDLIIQDTLALRNRIFPEAQIAVLSNASLIHKPKVFNALKRVNQNILKLDSAFETTVRHLNQPRGRFDLKRLIKNLIAFEGDLIIQTLFVRVKYKSRHIDNTSREEVDAWLEVLQQITPRQVMIYTIARDTPVDGMERVSYEDLRRIADRVEARGIPVQISD